MSGFKSFSAIVIAVSSAAVLACGGGAPVSQQAAVPPGQAAAPAPAATSDGKAVPPATAAHGEPSAAGQASSARDERSPETGSAAPGAAASAPAGGSALAPVARDAEPPAKPKFREVVVPAGTAVRLKLRTAVASDTSAVEDQVRATLDAPVKVGGTTAIPAGATFAGTVTSAQRSGKVKGRAILGLRFDRFDAWETSHDIRTARITRQARATKQKDATKIGIGAGAGALVGALAGGGKGAAIGATVGGGAGTGVVLSTRGEEVRLPAGTVVTTKLESAVTMQVPID